MDNFSELLDWDTSFFGKKIAKIVVNVIDEEYIKVKLSEYKYLDFDLVYIYVAKAGSLSPSLCSLYNCVLVDCKIVYYVLVDGHYDVSPFVSEFEGKPEQLYDLAFQCGVDSRFKSDGYFCEKDFLRLYKTWVDNSVAHLIANKVFVFNDGYGICGFVTVGENQDGFDIGLIATDVKRRGQGIGSKLLSAVKVYAKEKNISSLSVATQKKNTLACSFYKKNGFSLKSETNIYHAWLKK